MTGAELLSVFLGVVGTILTAAGGMVIAYFHRKTRELEASNKHKEAQINRLHNGFREEVNNRLTNLEETVSLVISLGQS